MHCSVKSLEGWLPDIWLFATCWLRLPPERPTTAFTRHKCTHYLVVDLPLLILVHLLGSIWNLVITEVLKSTQHKDTSTSTRTQVNKYTSKQVHEYTSTQVYKETSTLVHKWCTSCLRLSATSSEETPACKCTPAPRSRLKTFSTNLEPSFWRLKRLSFAFFYALPFNLSDADFNVMTFLFAPLQWCSWSRCSLRYSSTSGISRDSF